MLAHFPESMEIIDHRTNRHLGFAEFQQLVYVKSKDLANAGLKTGDRVVIGIEDPIDFMVSLIGCWEIGVCGVVVNPSLPAAEQKRVFDTVKPVIWLGDLRAELGPSPKSETICTNDAILVLMTSGTTGNPKGVMLNLDALKSRLDHNIQYIGRESLRNSLCVLPLFFGHGLIGNCLTVLAAGGRLTLWSTPTLHELRALPDIIEQSRIQFLSSVPSFWKLALPLTRKPEACLQRVHIGSAPLSLSLWEEIAEWAGTTNVYNTFGMSETANWISGGRLVDAQHRDGFVGAPWGGKFAIVSDGTIKTSGRGEVLVQNNSLMNGYLGQPEKSKEAMLNGWLRTGDIGELNDQGGLVLVGRIKSEINVGGIKVLSEEVELMLERHPSVNEACAFPVSDAVAGERVGVAVACKKEKHLDKETIVGWCLEQARKEVMPKQVFFLDEIPKNDRGKIVRAEVAKQCLGPKK